MIEELKQKLIKQLKQKDAGDARLWTGRLSSSAVSTAIAAFALSLRGGGSDMPMCRAAVHWLIDHVNKDGGWGDTPESPSNMTATLIVTSAISSLGYSMEVRTVVEAAKKWLRAHLGHDDFIEGILAYYGKDLTFSAPLLSMCTLTGFLPKDAWTRIPRLPFHLAILPRCCFTLVNISVVSYALPALIAVGLLQHRKSGNYSYLVDRLMEPRLLSKLESMQPSSGGFLEATPLTGFVAMCLHEAGLIQHSVTQSCMEFLALSQREDGSWPIDEDLSTWLSSHAIRALAANDALDEGEKARYREVLLSRQCRCVHPFTGANAGGWAWTPLPGGVPDADDSAGTLLTLALLDTPYDAQVEQGLNWLLRLLNRDGGMPTFCKGWGFLPFDRSCPDISAHALHAFVLWRKKAADEMQLKLDTAIKGILSYLAAHQDEDGAWTPLWFGDQSVIDKRNRVYGTAVVLEHLHALQDESAKPLRQRALDYLLSVQQSDGLWGGDKGAVSNIECSAKAIAALALYHQTREPAEAAVKALCRHIASLDTPDGRLPSVPIGLYFASLWYDEELYPSIFTLSALSSFNAS